MYVTNITCRKCKRPVAVYQTKIKIRGAFYCSSCYITNFKSLRRRKWDWLRRLVAYVKESLHGLR